MAQLAHHTVSSARVREFLDVRFRLRRILVWLQRAVQISRQRRALYRLDEGALHDLGLSRADAWQEADKPFWQQPAEEGDRQSC